MKPGPFRLVAAESVEEALDVLAQYGDDVSILAGGQSLVSLMNLRLARPGIVLDINRVPGLDRIAVSEAGSVSVGALVRAAVLERAAEVRHRAPVIEQAVRHIGHPQIRNRTTIGGNVAHADPSSELPGVLACMEGMVTLTSQARGSRDISWDEFFVSVFTTAKSSDEMVTSVTFPSAAGWHYAYDEFATRHGDYPMAGVTVGLRVEDGAIAGARMSVVGVSDRPVRLTGVEAAAIGRPASVETARVLAALARLECPATDDAHVTAEHRRWLVGTLVSRVMVAMMEEG